MTALIYEDEFTKLSGSVWKYTGRSSLVSLKSYIEATEPEFKESKIEFTREGEYFVNYKGNILQHKFYTDFTVTVNNDIIIKVKANKHGMSADAISQPLNYLKVSGFRLALLINFGKTQL